MRDFCHLYCNPIFECARLKDIWRAIDACVTRFNLAWYEPAHKDCVRPLTRDTSPLFSAACPQPRGPRSETAEGQRTCKYNTPTEFLPGWSCRLGICTSQNLPWRREVSLRGSVSTSNRYKEDMNVGSLLLKRLFCCTYSWRERMKNKLLARIWPANRLSSRGWGEEWVEGRDRLWTGSSWKGLTPVGGAGKVMAKSEVLLLPAFSSPRPELESLLKGYERGPLKITTLFPPRPLSTSSSSALPAAVRPCQLEPVHKLCICKILVLKISRHNTR